MVVEEENWREKETEEDKQICSVCEYKKIAHGYQISDQMFGLNRLEPQNKVCRKFKLKNTK